MPIGIVSSDGMLICFTQIRNENHFKNDRSSTESNIKTKFNYSLLLFNLFGYLCRRFK